MEFASHYVFCGERCDEEIHQIELDDGILNSAAEQVEQWILRDGGEAEENEEQREEEPLVLIPQLRKLAENKFKKGATHQQRNGPRGREEVFEKVRASFSCKSPRQYFI